MSVEDIPEDRQRSYPCPECDAGSVTQCDVSGDWICDNCSWRTGADDRAEAVSHDHDGR